MRLFPAQPVPSQPLADHRFPSDHNVRWRLLNINHNFMIKFKNSFPTHSQHLIRRHDKSLRRCQTTLRRAPHDNVEPRSRMDAPSTPFHQWLPLVFMLPHLFASLLKCFFYPFKLLFFPAPAPLCTKRGREEWGLL